MNIETLISRIIFLNEYRLFWLIFFSLLEPTILNYRDIDLLCENKSSKVEAISYYHLNLIFWRFYDIYRGGKRHRHGINIME